MTDQTFTVYGQAYEVTATFPESETDAANAHMIANEGEGVIAIRDGQIIIAKNEPTE